MSIKQAAQIVQSQGRGNDSMLMHVTPGEVQALQGIAQAHGGSLTVNPQSGLPEAGFLESVLPTVAGIGIGVATGNPFLGAAIAGGAGFATTGSLEKGLMAGIGAFGGSSALAGIGAAGAAGATGAAGAAGGAGAAGSSVAGTAASTSIAPTMIQPSAMSSAVGSGGLTGAQKFAGMGFGNKLGAIGQGFSNLGFSGSLEAMGTGNLLMGAAPLVGGMMGGESDFASPEPEGDKRQYDWDPVSGRFVKRPVVSVSDYSGPKRSVFAYADGGSVSREDQIQDLYQELVGREAQAADMEIWTRRQNQGLGVDDIRSQMMTSPEAIAYAQQVESDPNYRGPRQQFEEGIEDSNRNQIARMYREYLNRDPDSSEINHWADEIGYGSSMADVQNAIKASQEATNINNRADIQAAYIDALGRAPDQAGLEHYQQAMQDGLDPTAMRSQIMGSSEASGIRAAEQQRMQAFSPPPPTPMTPSMGATPAQQTGIGMIPNRYQAPVNTPSQGVNDYNQLLANRANYEYVETPMPDAMRPRSPQEMQNMRDQQLLGQQVRVQDIQQGAAQSTKPEESEATASKSNDDVYPLVSHRTGEAYAQGGITSIKNTPKFRAGGEMESDAFVVPADVVSALGNGSTDAGVSILNDYLGVAMPIEGDGDGLSDDVPATIEGEQPARVADGEVYIPAGVVAKLGSGDPERGAAKLYVMLDKIRESAHGNRQQQKKVKPEKVMP